ncbi:hypothetical protein GCM10023259_070220 [Thermocatellispora tengchongensis]
MRPRAMGTASSHPSPDFVWRCSHPAGDETPEHTLTYYDLIYHDEGKAE